MKKTLISILLIIIIMTSLFSSSCATKTSTTSVKTVNIGWVGEMSGTFASMFIPVSHEMTMTEEYINNNGGITIKGQKYNVHVIQKDGQSTMDGNVAAVHDLAYNDKVQFVIGPGGPFVAAAAPTFTPLGIMNLVMDTNMMPGTLGKDYPHTFNAFGGGPLAMEAVVLAMIKEWPNVKTVVDVEPDDGGIPYIVPVLKQVLAKYGITMVGDPIAYNNDQVDFNPIASKIHAVKADAIIQPLGIASHVGNILKGLRALGDTRPYVCTATASGSDVVAIAGADAATNLITLFWELNKPGNPAILDAIGNALMKKYGPENVMFMHDASCLYTLTKVMEAANSLDPKDVEAAWVNAKTIDTLFGPGLPSGEVTYGIRNHFLSHPLAYEITKNGQVEFGGWVTLPPIP